MFLLWLKLSATYILLPQQPNLNIIERKFKRQILMPDPIILATSPGLLQVCCQVFYNSIEARAQRCCQHTFMLTWSVFTRPVCCGSTLFRRARCQCSTNLFLISWGWFICWKLAACSARNVVMRAGAIQTARHRPARALAAYSDTRTRAVLYYLAAQVSYWPFKNVILTTIEWKKKKARICLNGGSGHVKAPTLLP